MAVRGYIGDYGAGKTFSAVADCWEQLHRPGGKDVYSNLSLVDMRVRRDPLTGSWRPVNPGTLAEADGGPTGSTGTGFGYFWGGVVRTWEEIIGLDNAIVLMDELPNLMHSHDWSSVPKSFRRWLNQQRKFGVDIYWTAPVNTMVDNMLRDTTSVTHICTRIGPIIRMEVQDVRSSIQHRGAKLNSRTKRVDPAVYHLYDTLEIMGSLDGEGYTRGKRKTYGALTEGQRVCLIRKFGPARIGIERLEDIDVPLSRRPCYQSAPVYRAI